MDKALNPKRQAILAAATRAFIAHGYSGASMEAIAEAAPVSKPTLYKHFKDKQALFAAVVAEQCTEFLHTVSAEQAETHDPVAGLTTIAAAFVELLYSDDALKLYRLIIAEQQQFPELGELVYRAAPEPLLRQLSAYLQQLHAQRRLHVPDVDMSSRLLLGMLQGEPHFRCLLGLQAGLSAAEKRQLIAAAMALFLNGHGYAQ